MNEDDISNNSGASSFSCFSTVSSSPSPSLFFEVFDYHAKTCMWDKKNLRLFHPIYEPIYKSSFDFRNGREGKSNAVLDILQNCNTRHNAEHIVDTKLTSNVVKLDNVRVSSSGSTKNSSMSPIAFRSFSRTAFSCSKVSKEKDSQQIKKRIRLSNRTAKAKGLFSPGKEGIRFLDMLPLHRLWIDYIADIFQNELLPVQEKAARLVQADLHGAFLKVERSSCPSYLGICGILIQETEQSFRLLGEDNKVRIVLKKQCVFAIEIDSLIYYLQGQHLLFSCASRSKMKSKHKLTLRLS